MAFSNKKLEPVEGFRESLPKIIFKSVRSSCIRTSKKNRTCFSSQQKIRKGEKYISHSFRYNGSIITISFDVHFFLHGHLNTGLENKKTKCETFKLAKPT